MTQEHTPPIWDPVDLPPTEADILSRSSKLTSYRNVFQRFPYLPVAVLAVFFFILPGLSLLYIPLSSDSGTLFRYVSMIGTAIFLSWLFRVEEDFARAAVAEAKGWTYLPDLEKFTPRTKALCNVLPESFPHKDSAFTHQWWGALPSRKGTVPFWVADYIYTPDNQKTECGATFYVFELFGSSRANFRVVSEDLGKKIKNVFTGSDIDLESAEFNRLFAIEYAGRRSDIDQDVFRDLNPALMLDLLKLREAAGPFKLFFRGNLCAITFNKLELVFKRHDLSNPTKARPKDQQAILDRLTSVLERCTAIAASLD